MGKTNGTIVHLPRLIQLPKTLLCRARTFRIFSTGEVTEWSIVLVSKTSVGASLPRVRISPSPLLKVWN